MAALIEPGQPFEVEYGNGHTQRVIALAGRRQSQLQKLLVRISSADKSTSDDAANVFDLVEEALAICCGDDEAKRLWETSVDIELAMEICQKTMTKNALSEDESKKSESPS